MLKIKDKILVNKMEQINNKLLKAFDVNYFQNKLILKIKNIN